MKGSSDAYGVAFLLTRLHGGWLTGRLACVTVHCVFHRLSSRVNVLTNAGLEIGDIVFFLRALRASVLQSMTVHLK